jgi:hypothetical protein
MDETIAIERVFGREAAWNFEKQSHPERCCKICGRPTWGEYTGQLYHWWRDSEDARTADPHNPILTPSA